MAAALRDLGLGVVMFEDLGGRDEDAVTAYLDGVAGSDIYIGTVGDRYGQMKDTRRSPAHEEYLYAEQQGKRVSFWVASEDTSRQGNARDFVQEVQAFHTTGRFDNPDDLARRVVERVAEIEADIRDSRVGHYLEGLRPGQWRHNSDAVVTTIRRSGQARIEEVTSESRSASRSLMTLAGGVAWADGAGDSMAMGTSGHSADDLTELVLRAGLFDEPLPSRPC